MMLAKFFLGFLGSAVYLAIFGCTGSFAGWDIPIWGYFIVAWMGHDSLYDYLSYVHRK